jgi:hypothetical protein
MMKGKKGASAIRSRTIPPGVSKFVVERRDDIGEFVRFAEKIARNPRKCRELAEAAGIFTATGRLTHRYK